MDQTINQGEVFPRDIIEKAIAGLPEPTFYEKHCQKLGNCDSCQLPACPIADQ
jgi:hypothetical protein